MDRLRVLLAAHAAGQAHVAMRVAGVHRSRVGRLLMLTGTNDLLDLYPSVEEALAMQAAGPGEGDAAAAE